MLTTLHPPLRSALAAITAVAAIAAMACSDAIRPRPPAADGAALAAGTGPLAIESVIGLEPLIGAFTNDSRALDINDLGQVVGSSASSAAGPFHAVIWDGSTFPTDLGALQGSRGGSAQAINSTGTVVVGYSLAIPVPVRRATRWVKVNGVWQAFDLGALPGPDPSPDQSVATDVADNGDIVGIASPDGIDHGVIWRNGIMLDLAPGLTTANGINNVGQVVGKNSAGHAAVWTEATGAIDIGTLGGTASEAMAINDAGEVTGMSLTSTGQAHAFVWSSRKGMQDLGPLTGDGGVGYGINEAALIVGASPATFGSSSAFAWSKGKFIVLDILPGYAGPGSHSQARAINNNKQIVGWSATASGDFRATLWTLK